MSSSASVRSADRLSQINKELSTILEERVEFLNRTLTETQRFTQQIASTELEIQRHESQHARLQEECEGLAQRSAELEHSVGAVESNREALQETVYAREKEIQQMEWALDEQRKNQLAHEDRIRGLDGQVSEIEALNMELEQELGRRNERIERLKKIRDEFLARIAALDTEEAGLSSLNK